MKFEDSRNYKVKAKKAEEILKFEPIYTVDEAIIELKRLLENGKIRDGSNPKYINQSYMVLSW